MVLAMITHTVAPRQYQSDDTEADDRLECKQLNHVDEQWSYANMTLQFHSHFGYDYPSMATPAVSSRLFVALHPII